MGNLLGGFDEAKQQRMQEIIQQVLGEFSKQFPLKYKDALIVKVKDALNQEEETKQLEECPVPDYVLKTGSMLKRGDVRKNWKKRYFVAKNKADNYVIEYYEAEGVEKSKGTINCCGYRVQDFNEEEVSKFGQGPHGIKLVPWDERRRFWYFVCETEDEKKEWEKIFQNACRKADPPVNKDPVIKNAFRNAYRATRYAYGYYGWWSITGTEAEVLGAFIGQVLERELLRDVYDNLPSTGRSQAMSAIGKIVDSAVISAVTAAWNGVLSAVDSVKGTIEKAASDLLNPLFEAEANLKDNIVSRVAATVNPVMEDLGARLCAPVFSRCLTHISVSYISAVRDFVSHTKDRVNRIRSNPQVLDSEYDSAQREIDYWYSGPMSTANGVLWRMYTSDLASIMDCFVGGYTAYDIYSNTLDDLRTLLHNATYTFYKYASEGGDPMDILADTLRKLIHDAKDVEAEGVKAILNSLISSTVDEKVIGPCKELVAPVNDMIPDALKELVNIETLVEEVIGDIVDGALKAIVSGGITPEQEKLQEALNELLPQLA
jgi:hypothetical protein